jgi:hypothetical protein
MSYVGRGQFVMAAKAQAFVIGHDSEREKAAYPCDGYTGIILTKQEAAKANAELAAGPTPYSI